MKTLINIFGICFLLAAVVTGAAAQESKIGYINTQRVTTESNLAKAAQAKLEQEFSKRQKDLGDLQAVYGDAGVWGGTWGHGTTFSQANRGGLMVAVARLKVCDKAV